MIICGFASLALAVSACATAPSPQKAEPDTSGTFVTVLGRDTVVVESFTRKGNKVDGNMVVRVPGTVLIHYEIDLSPTGFPSRSVVDVNPLGTSEVWKRRVTIDFKSDSAVVDVDSSGKHAVVRRAVGTGLYPQLMTGFGSSYGLYASPVLYELYAPVMNAAVGDTVRLTALDIFNGRLVKRRFIKRSATVLDADYFGIGETRLTLDASGHITAGDAAETTEQTQMTRIPFVDAGAMAKRFASQDRDGKGVGTASPDVTERAKVGGAPFVISYSSPRRRDRDLLGKVIPYGEVWRTGANTSTTLFVDRSVDIGGKQIAAGVYSLWTLPKADGSVDLIVNAQHGQWGTDYDASHDIAHIPMTASKAATPQENFAIAVSDGNPGALRISWGTFVWTVPVSVAK